MSGLWADFDESTLITPNDNGEKEKGIVDKVEYEIEKSDLVEFAKSSSISVEEILLASLTLTLNKFNFQIKLYSSIRIMFHSPPNLKTGRYPLRNF